MRANGCCDFFVACVCLHMCVEDLEFWESVATKPAVSGGVATFQEKWEGQSASYVASQAEISLLFSCGEDSRIKCVQYRITEG